MSESTAVVEIKKERLARHLNQVERHLAQWLVQIDTPMPFSQVDLNPQNIQVSPYQPPLERDNDINHMLRKHLSSRVLWRHHSDWMLLQESLAKAANRLVKLGQVRIDKLAQEEGIQPTSWFLNSALEDAFSAVAGLLLNSVCPVSQGLRFNTMSGRWPIRSSFRLVSHCRVIEALRTSEYALPVRVRA